MNSIKNLRLGKNWKSKILSLEFLSFLLVFYILISGFFISEASASETPQAYSFLDASKTISMDFKDVSLKDILKAFSIQAGVNFIASQEIEDKTVTLYLDKVMVKDALDKLFRANHLDYEFDENAKIILVKKEEPRIETITKIYPLKYASVSNSSIRSEIKANLGGGEDSGGIIEVIKGLISEYGSAIEDSRTNSLIITDILSRHRVFQEALVDLDIAMPQVMLEVEILDVSKSLVDKLGFNPEQRPFTLYLPKDFINDGAKFFIGDLANKARDGTNGLVSIGATYAAYLDFWRQDKDTRSLARPRILTLSNETAEISIITDEVIGEDTTENTDVSTTTYSAVRAQTGVTLRVTPQVNLHTGEITMFVYPRVGEATSSNFSSQIDGVTYRDPEERSSKSVVKIKSGETIIVGGLIRNSKIETINKIPLLGDLPFIGRLFRHRYKEQDLERELLVFITPHIIKDNDNKLTARADSAILSSREQDISPKEEARLMTIQKALDGL